MDYTDSGVGSSSHFPIRVQTDRQAAETYRVTDTSDRPTHESATAEIHIHTSVTDFLFIFMQQ